MKSEFQVRFEGYVLEVDDAETRPPSPEDLERFLDGVMDHLIDLGAETALIETQRMSEGRVQVVLSVSALDPEAALAEGSSYIRTAFHALGAATPGWSVHWVRVNAQPDQAPVKEKKAKAKANPKAKLKELVDF